MPYLHFRPGQSTCLISFSGNSCRLHLSHARPGIYAIEEYAALCPVFPKQASLSLTEGRELVVVLLEEGGLAVADDEESAHGKQLLASSSWLLVFVSCSQMSYLWLANCYGPTMTAVSRAFARLRDVACYVSTAPVGFHFLIKKAQLTPGLFLKRMSCQLEANTSSLGHHTWQALALTIFCPGLQLKALAKSSLFCTVPFTRYSPGECGSVFASRRALSGVRLSRHI